MKGVGGFSERISRSNLALYIGIRGERPLLNVKVPQSLTIAEIILGKAEKVSFPDVIHGRDKYDMPITLFGCGHPSHNKSAGLTSYEFHPMIAILGQELESWGSANYTKVNLHYSLLTKWMGHTCISPKAAGQYERTLASVRSSRDSANRAVEAESWSSVEAKRHWNIVFNDMFPS